MYSLTTRQRRFVKAYVGKAEGNATEAARIAGYPHPNTAGPRLSENDGIREAISRTLEDAAISPNEILSRLSDMATADIADFVVVKGDAVTLDLTRTKKRRKSHLIKSIKSTQYGLVIELHDAQSALDKLARIHGMYESKPSVSLDIESALTEGEHTIGGQRSGSAPLDE